MLRRQRRTIQASSVLLFVYRGRGGAGLASPLTLRNGCASLGVVVAVSNVSCSAGRAGHKGKLVCLALVAAASGAGTVLKL